MNRFTRVYSSHRKRWWELRRGINRPPDTFTLEEYRTLRKEIEDSKTRLFALIAAGFPLLTAANFFAYLEQAKKCPYTVLLPLLVVVLGLLFVIHNNSIYRAGNYIRNKIEPNVNCGWEKWLNTLDDKYDHRCVDKEIRIILLMLYIIYYLVASLIATHCSFNVLNISLKRYEVIELSLFFIVIAAYLFIGVYSVIFLITNTYSSTDFKEKCGKKHARR